MSRHRQILDAIAQGIVVLDRDLRVETWNHWMAAHSGIPEEKILGRPLLEFYPNLDKPSFHRNCRAVLLLGNFAFFSQKLHGHLFPMVSSSGREPMQQSCVMGPVRGGLGSTEALFITVQDVTDLVAQERRLEQLNMRDALTGVFNRGYLDHRLDVELERARRYGRSLSLLLLDIDHFKRVNDTLGHQGGDAALVALAARLTGAVRRSDVVARYGGEEFCCILPETDLPAAMVVAEKLRAAVQGSGFTWRGKPHPLTVSIGAATVTGNDASSGLIENADRALYEAKVGGRNRAVAARGSPRDEAEIHDESIAPGVTAARRSA